VPLLVRHLGRMQKQRERAIGARGGTAALVPPYCPESGTAALVPPYLSRLFLHCYLARHLPITAEADGPRGEQADQCARAGNQAAIRLRSCAVSISKKRLRTSSASSISAQP
jgi:hypothetical protein